MIYISNILSSCLIAVFVLGLHLYGSSQEIVTEPDGYKTFYYGNGVKSSEGIMEAGKPNGYWRTYYPTGQLKSEGNRKNFELDSAWVFYNNEGYIENVINYSEGIKHGDMLSYRDGALYSRELFASGLKEGLSYVYFPSGEVQTKVTFVNGKENGTAYEYGKDGRIITIMEYEAGVLRKVDQINRLDRQGRRQGRWLEYFPNGNIHWEGYFSEGLKNGLFKTYDKDGKLLTLDLYRNDQLVEDAESTVILDIRNTYFPNGKVKSTGGYTRDGKKEGVHRIYDEEGGIVSGVVYSNGEKTGEGVVDKSGMMQGPWQMYFADGTIKAEGAFEDGTRSGDWTFYHRNGKVEQKGKYIRGLPNGQWKWYHDNGQLAREEFFRRGKEDGDSIEYDRDGEVITKGQYVDGLRDGDWYYKMNDHTEKGAFRDGERHGDWRYIYDNGKTNFEGSYMAGLPNGRHRWYHPNGILKLEGKWANGLREGDWRAYDEEGNNFLTIKYKRGIEVKINGTRVKMPELDDLESSN